MTPKEAFAKWYRTNLLTRDGLRAVGFCVTEHGIGIRLNDNTVIPYPYRYEGEIHSLINDKPESQRAHCPLRHSNGNCLPCGGFCTAVNDDICNAIRQAYEQGVRDGMTNAAPCQLPDDVKISRLTNLIDHMQDEGIVAQHCKYAGDCPVGINNEELAKYLLMRGIKVF